MVYDAPTIFFGSKFENVDDEETPPFYLILNVHDMIVHNVIIDSGASHNLMPKGVVESLGLEVTRPYKDLYSFDSSKVKCLGLIKDIVVTLTKIPSNTIVMDVVVEDIPPFFLYCYQGHGLQNEGDLTYGYVLCYHSWD